MKRIWYNNGKEERLLREGQPVPEGFIVGRIHKITEFDKLCETYSKEFIYQKYIIENTPFHLLSQELGILDKQLRKLLTKYKINKSPKDRSKNNTYRRSPEEVRLVAEKSAKTQRERWEKLPDEEKSAWRAKQREAHSTESFRKKISEVNVEYNKQLKETNQELYADRNRRRKESCKKAWSNPELIEQRNEMAKQNREKNRGMLCRTIAEQKLYDTLILKYNDLQYDIKVDERYPFFCDFYIPSVDTFIELQAHPSHGRLPISFLSVDEYSIYPNRFVDVFAGRDVEKERCAKASGIHLIRIYPRATIDENLLVNEKEDSELVKLCYLSQKQCSRYNVANCSK